MDIETALADFLRWEASLPPYPGACCRMAEKWVMLVKGFSPLDRYGRNFTSDIDVQAWLAEPGGIAVAVNRVMRCSDFAKTKTPQPGDVGLAVHDQRLCMSVLAPHGWMSRDESGMICVPPDKFWKAWRVEID